MNREQLPKDTTKTGGCFTIPSEKHAFDTGYFTAQQDMLDAGYCLIPVGISIDKVESLSHFGVVRDWIIKLKNGKQIEISADVIKKIVKHEREENNE